MRFLKRGEYDLANISLIGHDPLTGRSYEECHAEWQHALDQLALREAAVRWWNIVERIRIKWQAVILAQRLGL